jgi:quercetin dioxygenase-like cupin family protein
MPWAVVDASDFEERRKPIASALGSRAIRLNRFDNQPDQAGKEHDERGTGQEEIYIPVEGAGILRVGGEEVTLRPGRFVLVSPEVTRQVVAGPEGLAYVVVGARPEP